VGHRPPILLGYSHGAIAAAAAILGDRRLPTGAVLLRPLSPLSERAFPRLDGYPILLVCEENDARRDSSDGPSLEGPGWLSGVLTRRLPLDCYREALDRRPDDVKMVVTF
jgi:hypothetical protein